MNPLPLIVSVATAVAMLAVLVGVADGLAERRMVLETAVSPQTDQQRTAAIAPDADQGPPGPLEAAPPEPLPPIGHMRPPPRDPMEAAPDPADSVRPPEIAEDQPGNDPIPTEEGSRETTPAAPAPPPAADPSPLDEQLAPPRDITPPDPQAPVELAETRDAAEEPQVADEPPLETQDTHVAALPPEGEAESAPDPDAIRTGPADGRIVIQEGNNLWHLARVIYGSGAYYLLIFDANRDTISNPNDIFPGQVLVTPGVTPPEIVPPDLREPLAGLEYDMPAELAGELEALQRAARNRR
jgi:nucleoid-associated protein YgaU